MQWVWTLLVIIVVAVGGYYVYGSKPKEPVVHELHTGKATLVSKNRQHNALWIHYNYTDTKGKPHDMSERVPYIDLWESLKVGQEIEIVYDDEGRSVLKVLVKPKGQ